MSILDVDVESERLKLDVVSRAQRLINAGCFMPGPDVSSDLRDGVYQARIKIFEALLTTALLEDRYLTLDNPRSLDDSAGEWTDFISTCLAVIWNILEDAVRNAELDAAMIDAAIYENNMQGEALLEQEQASS